MSNEVVYISDNMRFGSDLSENATIIFETSATATVKENYQGQIKFENLSNNLAPIILLPFEIKQWQFFTNKDGNIYIHANDKTITFPKHGFVIFIQNNKTSYFRIRNNQIVIDTDIPMPALFPPQNIKDFANDKSNWYYTPTSTIIGTDLHVIRLNNNQVIQGSNIIFMPNTVHTLTGNEVFNYLMRPPRADYKKNDLDYFNGKNLQFTAGGQKEVSYNDKELKQYIKDRRKNTENLISHLENLKKTKHTLVNDPIQKPVKDPVVENTNPNTSSEPIKKEKSLKELAIINGQHASFKKSPKGVYVDLNDQSKENSFLKKITHLTGSNHADVMICPKDQTTINSGYGNDYIDIKKSRFNRITLQFAPENNYATKVVKSDKGYSNNYLKIDITNSTSRSYCPRTIFVIGERSFNLSFDDLIKQNRKIPISLGYNYFTIYDQGYVVYNLRSAALSNKINEKPFTVIENKAQNRENYLNLSNANQSTLTILGIDKQHPYYNTARNTIDISQAKKASLLDIRGEEMSSINGHKNNLFITDQHPIHNIQGSNQGDTLILNKYDNIVTGGHSRNIVYLTDTYIDYKQPNYVLRNTVFKGKVQANTRDKSWGFDVYYKERSRYAKKTKSDVFILDIDDHFILDFNVVGNALIITQHETISSPAVSSLKILNYIKGKTVVMVRSKGQTAIKTLNSIYANNHIKNVKNENKEAYRYGLSKLYNQSMLRDKLDDFQERMINIQGSDYKIIRYSTTLVF